jgi:hypothetical protein
MTHSLVVMLRDLGCDIGAGDMALLAAPRAPADGRIAIGGAVEQEDVGVETFVGEAAEAGLAAELGES